MTRGKRNKGVFELDEQIAHRPQKSTREDTMKIIRFLHWICLIGSISIFAFLLLMDFGLLPTRGTEFSRGITHITALLIMGTSIFHLFRD